MSTAEPSRRDAQRFPARAGPGRSGLSGRRRDQLVRQGPKQGLGKVVAGHGHGHGTRCLGATYVYGLKKRSHGPMALKMLQ